MKISSRSTPTGTAALFSFRRICQIKPDEASSIFFFPLLFFLAIPPPLPLLVLLLSLLPFLVPAFVLWLQVSYIIHEDWEAYPVLVILDFIPKKGAIFKRRIGQRWRRGNC